MVDKEEEEEETEATINDNCALVDDHGDDAGLHTRSDRQRGSARRLLLAKGVAFGLVVLAFVAVIVYGASRRTNTIISSSNNSSTSGDSFYNSSANTSTTIIIDKTSNSSSPTLTRRPSACNIGQQLFKDYKTLDLDEKLGLDIAPVSRLVIALAGGGSLAVAAPEWNNQIRFPALRATLPKTKPFQSYKVNLKTSVTAMAYSGSGQYLLVAAELDTIVLALGMQRKVPFPDPSHLYNHTKGSMGYRVSDVAMSYSGSILAIAYGTDDMEPANLDIMHSMGSSPIHNAASAMVAVFQRVLDTGTERDWEMYLFPSNQTDNFGVQLAMTSSGKTVYTSSTHDNSTHKASLIYKLAWDWWDGDGADLMNKHECTDVLSDVAASSDGTIVVVAVQCWKQGKGVTVFLYPFTGPVEATVWDEKLSFMTRELYTDALKPFSLTMAGDGSVTVLYVEGFLLERFDGAFWEGPGSGTSIILDQDEGTISVEISENAETIVLAAASAVRGGSVCVLQQ